MRVVFVGDFSSFKVAQMTSPGWLPAPKMDSVCLDLNNKRAALFSLNETCCFQPSGWRDAARACKVEWSRSSGSCVTYRPDVGLHGRLVGLHPHISSSSAAALSDEELVAVDHKKNIRAMSRKRKEETAREEEQVREQVGWSRGWGMRGGFQEERNECTWGQMLAVPLQLWP